MKNLKTSSMLAVSFSLIIILMVGLGVFAIVQLQNLDATYTAVFDNEVNGLYYMGQINRAITGERSDMRAIVIYAQTGDKEKVESLKAHLEQNRALVTEYAPKYLSTIREDDSKGTEDFEKTDTMYKDYLAKSEVFIQLASDMHGEEALNELIEMTVEIEDLLERVSVLLSNSMTRAFEESDQASLDVKESRTMMLILLGAVVVLTVVAVIMVSSIISKPLVAIAAIADKVSEGNTDVDCSAYFGKSETGLLAQSFDKMINAVKTLVGDTNILVESSRAGQLDTRADVSKHKGDYRRIVEGINDMLDGVVTPINEASMVLSEMAQGNLGASVKGAYLGDHARIKNALNDTIKQLNGYIGDLKYALASMAKGNFDVEITSEFRGDFISLKDSTNDIADSMSDILRGINTASDQVAAGTKQVSDGAQAVSQGATEQASAIEELTATITEISEQVRNTAENAGEVNRAAEQTKQKATEGNEQMRQMQEAMEAINASSANISKIIKVIDDIAFQTNILALNAAVEAARAGVHGKGFAVVAEEVRNLAAKSASAAKETTDLIESSIGKTKAGTQIANDTAHSLQEIEAMVQGAVDSVGLIASASNEEALGISQVNKGIEQMSQVVQANSATSEQTAAAAEELSSQADMLKSMISRFTLRSESHRANRGPRAIPAPSAPNRPAALQSGMQDRPRQAAQRPAMRDDIFARPSMPKAEYRQDKPMGLDGYERFSGQGGGMQDILNVPDMPDEPDFSEAAEKYSDMDTSQMSDHDFGKY